MRIQLLAYFVPLTILAQTGTVPAQPVPLPAPTGGIAGSIGGVPSGVIGAQYPGNRIGGQPQQPSGPPGSISGQVVTTSGEPVRKAEVFLNGPAGPQVALTDDAGNFTITEVPPGNYFAQAQKAGFARFGSGRMSRGIQVQSAQETKGVTIKLERQAVITGKVLNADGEPMANANVQIMRQMFQRGIRTWMPSGGAQINDLGEYRAHSMAPGKYIVAVMPNQMMPMGQARRAGNARGATYITTYYPGVFEPSQAQVLDAKAGMEVRVDMQLRHASVFSVKGFVNGLEALPPEPPPGPQNAPIPMMRGPGGGRSGVMINAIPEGSATMYMGGQGMGRVKDDGTFEVHNLAPGSYTLIATRMNNSRGRGMAAIQVGNQNIEGISISLQPPMEVPLTIRVEGDSNNSVDTKAVRAMLEAERMGPLDGQMYPGGQAPGADAPRTLTGYPSGKLRVQVLNPPAGHYVKSVKVGSVDVTDKYFDGAGLGPVDVALAPGAGKVTATIQDSTGKAQSGAFIVLAPESSKRNEFSLYKFGQTNESGSYVVQGLKPGEYTLFAFPDAMDGAFQDPEVLKLYENKGTRVKMAENGNETVQAKLIEITQ